MIGHVLEKIDEQHQKLVEILNRLAFHLIHSSSVIVLDSVLCIPLVDIHS